MARPPNYKELDELEIRGRISAKATKELRIVDKKVLKIFETSIKKNSSGGAYISTSQEFSDHRAYVIVMGKN